MAKKKKKKQKKYQSNYQRVLFNITDDTSKKRLRKDFNSAIDEIEEYQLTLDEIDKLHGDKKKRKEINRKQRDFYTQMEAIKARKKMMKKWENDGFLDRLVDVLNDVIPAIRKVAKAVMLLILSFMSIDAIKRFISPETLNKLATVYRLAMAI